MKVTTIVPLPTNEKKAIFACDVSKDEITLHTKLGKQNIDQAFPNRTPVIESSLADLYKTAKQSGFSKILLVSEPTGIYHKTLFSAAIRLGFETRWVNPEAVAKMRVIETNDDGKTDIKDPQVIHTLASLGKTLKYRELKEHYQLLREWNGIYEAADSGMVATRCAIHPKLKTLFPDYNFNKDFLYGRSGAVLMKCYGCNPYKIIRKGRKDFKKTMKTEAPGIWDRTIKRLFDQAQSSVKNGLDTSYTEILEIRLRQLCEEFELYQKRKLEARQSMETLYEELRINDPKLPKAEKGIVTSFYLARIIAETGPLSDFPNWRKLIRFAGQNLRERQSGTYRGKTKISKKGRPLLRKVLNQAVLPLVKRSGLYGEYYHSKKVNEKMSGTKAMTAVSRKFLKMLYGWYKSGKEFDKTRVFMCESSYTGRSEAA